MTPTTRTVTVTGGAGFIGGNLCRGLASVDGTRVRAFDDLSAGSVDNIAGAEVELIEGSILDEALLNDVGRDTDVFVHLAARRSVPFSLVDPLTTHAVNATGTVNVLEAARLGEADQVIVASSSSVYGANPVMPMVEDQPTRPISPYGASKVATETYALAYAASFGLPVLPFRFFNVFGRLQPADHVYAAVIPKFIDAALAGRPLEVHGDGTQTRDFTYVDSVVAVVRDAIERRVTSPRPVNLAFGARTSLLEVIGILERLLGRPVQVEHTEPRAGDIHDSQSDPTNLVHLFPDVRPVSLEDGLSATLAWFQEGADPRSRP